MRRKPVALALASVLAICSIGLTGCGEKEEAVEVEEILEVYATNPETGDISVETEFMGTLEPQDETSVFPKMSGEVTETFFEIGDYVEAGELLFTLDDKAANLQMDTAEAAYATAQAGVNQQLGALNMNRDAAVNSLMSAQEGISQTQYSYDYYSKQIGNIEGNIQDIEDDKDDLKGDKKNVKKNLKNAKAGLEDAKNGYAAAEAAYNEAKASGASEEELEPLKENVDRMKGIVSEASEAVATLSASLASIEKGIDGYDSAIDQLESSEDTVKFQRGNLEYSYAQAQRGAALAQESLDYYDNYTLPSTQETANATMKSAKVAVDSAQMQLDNTQITAPVSGIIEKKNVDKFDMAQAGMPAYVITNRDAMMANFYVTESVYRTLSLGQSVTVERNGVVYSGKISELPLTIDAETSLFKIKATVDGSSAELISGTAVKLITTTSHVENIMTIPVECIYYDAEQAYVYTVENGVAKKTIVEVGLFDNEKIHIVSGLDADAEVITSWSSDLRDGVKVATSREEAKEE